VLFGCFSLFSNIAMVDFMSVKFVVRESGGSGTICGA
jgi:hypothetical protein